MAGVTKQQQGLLPDYYHPVLKFGLGTAYGLLQGRLLWRFERQTPSAHRPGNEGLLRSILVFTFLNLLLYPPVLLAMLLPLNGTYVTIFAVCALGSYLLVTCTLLFFQPRILYGMRNPVAAEPDALPAADSAAAPFIELPIAEKEDFARAYSLSDERKQAYRARLEAHMREQQYILHKGYVIKDLSA